MTPAKGIACAVPEFSTSVAPHIFAELRPFEKSAVFQRMGYGREIGQFATALERLSPAELFGLRGKGLLSLCVPACAG